MPQKNKLNHIAIIMDGNRRWAKNKGLPTLSGHQKGYQKMEKVAKWCAKKGIKILTVYAFSSENWNRQKSEVDYLMNLLRQAFKNDLQKLLNEGVRIKVIGQKQRLSFDIRKMIEEIENKSKKNKKFLFQIAISYGGRPDIIQAVKKIATKKIPAKKITENLISKNLWTQGVLDPDLIVRTSGEYRLSNFLTWQSAYSELIFIKKHWPEFGEKDLDKVINEYNQRQRRFGK